MSTRLKVARVELLLFLALWLGYGLCLNSANLAAYNLQQLGVESIVERGHFYLEGSELPEMQPHGDVFVYEGHSYAAKQPGQFLAGALAYAPLHALGLSYRRDFLLTTALVTLLTATLVVALSAVALYRTALLLVPDGAGPFWPLASALTYALATTVFPYAGVAHHDALACGYLVVALYLVVRLSRREPDERRDGLAAAGAGLMLGLTVTTSGLTLFMSAVVAVYFLTLRRWRLVPHFLAGGLAGIAPLLVYNYASFGNPLLVPNVAGNYRDTFFNPTLKNFLSKLRLYAWALTAYEPIFWLGLAGLALLPRELRRVGLLLAALVLVLAAYVLNIEADGTCQYGPRYMLPAMSCAALGLAGFAHLGTRARRAAVCAVAAAGLFSLAVNLLGALRGTMFCEYYRYAFAAYLEAARAGTWPTYPLAPWLVLPFAACTALLARELLRRRRTQPDV